MKACDVVIIGLGPAGLMAARMLANKRVDFLGIDIKKEIGLPLKCGEGVREDKFIGFFGHKNYDFVRNTVRGHIVNYKNFKRTFKANFLQLDRPKFEKFLAKPIEKNLILKTRCNDIIIKKDLVEIITNKGVIKTKLAILCCGCDYRIQKKFNLVKKKQTFFIAYGGVYKNCDLDRDKFHTYFDDKYIGYLWIFPKNKEIANIGFGTIRKVNVKEALKNLLKKYNINAKQISSYAGIVPCSGPIEKTYTNRLLVCGNAAGHVFAGTGEGIYFALEGGKLAAVTAIKAVKENRFDENYLKQYESAWKKSFGKLMKAGKMFFDLEVLAFRKVKMEYLFKAPTEEEIRYMIIDGKFPLKAKIAWFLSKII